MNISLSVDYLPPIRLGPYQWVEVALPVPHKVGNPGDCEIRYEQPGEDEIPEFTVAVFDDVVYVRTAEDTRNRRDGAKIWTRPKEGR